MTTDEPKAELLSQRKLECELKLNETESIYMPGKYKMYAIIYFVFLLLLLFVELILSAFIRRTWYLNMNDWIIFGFEFVKGPLQSF